MRTQKRSQKPLVERILVSAFGEVVFDFASHLYLCLLLITPNRKRLLVTDSLL